MDFAMTHVQRNVDSNLDTEIYDINQLPTPLFLSLYLSLYMRTFVDTHNKIKYPHITICNMCL